MKIQHIRWCTVVLCGLATLALAPSVIAKDDNLHPTGVAVDLHLTVMAVREVPAGNPLPGLHLDAKVKGRTTDIYIAPMTFVAKYGIKVSKGDEVHIIGTQTTVGETDVVLAREIGTGWFNDKTGVFQENLATYLRNDDGPFWDEAKPVSALSSVY